MNGQYLEVTFRHGRPLAAYLYLPRRTRDRSARTRRVPPGLVVDLAPDGRLIGIQYARLLVWSFGFWVTTLTALIVLLRGA